MARIAIDARMFGSAFTGVGKYTERLLETLAKHAEKYTFVIIAERSSVHKIQSISEKFEVHGVDIPHYSIKEQIALPFLLRKLQIDLVHYLHFNSPIFSRIPSIVTIHDLILSFYPGKSLGGYIKEKAYRMVLGSITTRAKTIISVSSHTKKDLVELLSLDESRIEVIHNGVDRDFEVSPREEERAKLAQAYGLQDGYILAVGVHRVHKNFGRLVEAFAILRKNGYRGKLIFAGKEDPRNHEVRDMIRLHDLSQSVVITGYIEQHDLETLVSGACVFIMPSLYEGFGIPILEAMVAGVPVACSQTTSLPEIGGDAARYFHPLRVDEMARCITEILEDKELQTQMIEAGKKRVLKFSWENMGEHTLDIYAKVLKSLG